MYVPRHFRVEDRATLLALAADNAFATVITQGDGGLLVSHLPLLVGESSLRGHLARENPQLAHLAAGAETTCIFHGPHAYISPTAYAEHPSVPTWNYAVVHVRGRARLSDEAELPGLLDELVARFDTTGWRFDAPADYRHRMLRAIAGFEIPIESLEGKWKLSQNRSADEQRRVIAWLDGQDASSQAVAGLMRRTRG
jgi:transcriptional regulator